ncbi:MAG: acetylglutamate kinase [Salinibacter sp.]|uniref:amino acid kinase family protein n=1 Tax=Salinibacter sp. TaxID=2065818 RepID=UPI0035D3D9C0
MAAATAAPTLYLVYLDRHHLGDALFLKSMAQHFSQSGSEAPFTLLVHGSGEKVERTLEAQGYFPERTGGVLDVETDEQRRLVERAVREVNQDLVATLTDEVVSTVGIQGVDRGLLQMEEDGALQASDAGWVSALIKQHVVPVVSALVENPDTGKVHEVQTAKAVEALAQTVEASFSPVACMFTTAEESGLHDGTGGVLDEVSADAITGEHVPNPEAARELRNAGLPVLITSPQGLLTGNGPRGTRLRA